MIPKRAVSALLTTVFALALLFSFKTPAVSSLAGTSSSGLAIVGQPTAPSTSTPTSPTASAATSAAPATTGTAYVDGTVTGSLVTTRFGNVQVQVTISGGVLTDVVALQLPSGDRRTDQISSTVEPILREEALTAQSARIDMLSGATYTSRGYAQSLQAALDEAAA